ncbi:MAG TPA: polysaccharide pyruvyl transferase family protein [Thermoanaerobaculia bacterium]
MTSSRPVVLIAGYYGFGNIGDEAILAAILNGLQARSPLASVRAVVISGDPADTRHRHGVEAVAWRDLPAIVRAARDCDLVLVGGGGLFQDLWGVDPGSLLTPNHYGISFYAGPAILAALEGKPLALLGLGIGPLASPEARRMVRGVCEASAFLSVRDAQSRDLLIASGVEAARITLSADPAFALAPARRSAAELLREAGIEAGAASPSPLVAVALRPWALGADPERWEAEVAGALDRLLAKTGGTLLFVPFQKSARADEDDAGVAARVRRRLSPSARAAELPEPLSPSETRGLLASCDLVVAMRLHAAVFAAAGAVPLVGIGYDPKLGSLFERLDLLSLLEPLESLSGWSLQARMESALEGEKGLRARLAEAAGGLRRLAEEDVAAAAGLLGSTSQFVPPPVTESQRALFAQAIAANMGTAGSLDAQAAELRRAVEDRERLLGEARAAREVVRVEHDRARGDQERLSEELARVRGELHEIHGSRVWKAANWYWRARRFAARLARPLRRSAQADWVGRNLAPETAAAAPPPSIENRHDIVLFAGVASSTGKLSMLATSLAASGHRVYRVSGDFRSSGPAWAIASRSGGFAEVTLALPGEDRDEDLYAALDALRRDESLGATLALVEEPAWLPVAERLRERRAWPLLTEPEATRPPEGLALLFPRISVVVVTYDNRELNRVCLESLAARTEWPNWELIVVDNGSTDGTRELLEEQQRLLGPRMRVLFQGKNRGFAAACNAGLAAATGEYLVLLNNDTVTTRGALTALVRHLAADPSLGLVGPVTNAIANEARVEVGYGGLADLPGWARDYVRTHDGETFALPMLALFCAALPRRVFDAVGALDERFGLGMFEDDDYCRRVAEKGLAIRCARDAFVHHWQMASFRKMPQERYLALFAENKKKYAEKWGRSPAPRPSAPGDSIGAQLAHVIDRAAASRGAVVFLPSIGWGISLVQRPHHLARVLAKRGYVVVFDCSNSDDKVDGFREVEPNVFLFRGEPQALHAIPNPLLWAFPYNVPAAEAFPSGARLIYDWIDDLEVFPYDPAMLARNHERALKRAALVLCVARRLHEQALQKRPDALYVPNGVEYERFAAPAAPPRDEALAWFLSGGGPAVKTAGYYGALARWFDAPLLDAVARENPDWRFVLIGQELDKSLAREPLLKRENVLWLGPRDYETLPGYLASFDVATIPFRINPITLSTSPLKLFEYFAGGKPVVTTPMPECEAFPEVEIARDAPAFSAALARARAKGSDPAFRERLRALGRENSWGARVDVVLAALHGGTGDGAPPAPREAGESGVCNICGASTRFSCDDPALARESMTCASCLATSRYRSIARGLLEAFRRLAGVDARSLAELPVDGARRRVSVYDTQTPFSTGASAYPIPDWLARCSWIDLHLSTLRPGLEAGQALGARTTNQNLERLSFPDASFDIVITSDVMEHVRLEDRAHREIRRVLRPGGVYLFTVPHFRNRETVTRVEIVDPDDPSRDRHLMEPEYHGNANSEDGRALAYRAYGIDLDERLRELGFSVEYTKQDFPENGIRNTELFFCRLEG